MPDVTTPARTLQHLPYESDLPLHGWKPYSDMHRERVRAHAKHDSNGGSIERKTWDDPAWLPVLVEEVGEVARVLCDFRHLANEPNVLFHHLREELVQVGAMVAAWVEALDDVPLVDPAGPEAVRRG